MGTKYAVWGLGPIAAFRVHPDVDTSHGCPVPTGVRLQGDAVTGTFHCWKGQCCLCPPPPGDAERSRGFSKC